MRFYSYIGLVVFLSFTYSSNAQLGFGDNLWNVNCYNSIAGDLHTLPSEYRGYYTQKLDVAGNIGFDSNLSWNADNGLPSNSTVFNNSQGVGSAYTGSIIDASGRNFSYVHKRKGFPSGKYRLTLKEWDDKTYVFINGIHRPFTGENGWGSNRMLVNCFELNEHSTIEVVTRNDGGGKTQAVLDIVKTDVLISEAIGVQQICKGSEIVLNGKVILGVANVNHDLYGLNFEVGSGTYTSSIAADWNENASVGTTGSGSAYISGTAPTPVNGDKWVKFGPFSTVGFSNLQLSYRHYYDHGSGKRARVEISNDNSNWSTASEQYSDYFVVEKSRDLKNWTTVAVQNASGTSNTQINYSSVDAHPWNDLTYYRLRQTDFNGSEKIYGPISSSCDYNDDKMKIHPNPSSEGFTIEIFSNQMRAGNEIQFMDVTGKIIAFRDYKLHVGMNQFYFNTTDLMTGIYHVRLVGENTFYPPMRLVLE